MASTTIARTICQTEEYASPRKGLRPDPMFSEIAETMNIMTTMETVYERAIRASMARAVFGSNLIESEGLKSIDGTIKVCLQIWKQDAESDQHLYSNSAMTSDHDCTVQHARAFDYAYRQLVLQRNALTHDCLLMMHGILLNGDEENLPGQYRDGPCYIGPDNYEFAKCETIHGTMTDLIDFWNKAAETIEAIDPYVTMAEFSIGYIKLHPFFDGNGRTSRILVNCFLLRFNLPCSSFGLNAADKKLYLSSIKIGVQAGQGFGALSYESLKAAYKEAMHFKDFWTRTGHAPHTMS